MTTPQIDAVLDAAAGSPLHDLLARHEEHLQHFDAINPLVQWITDPEGRIISVSRRWQALTGQPPEQALNEGWKQFIHPDDTAAYIGAGALGLLRKEHYEIRFRGRMSTGEFRWFRSRGHPRMDENGNVICVYGFTEDVHGQVLAEQALREREQALRQTEERYRIAARGTNDLIWDWDLTTDRIHWSGALQDWFGCTLDQFCAEAALWKDCIHPQDRARVLGEVEAVLAGGDAQYSGEYRLQKVDGSYAIVHDRGHVIRDGGGRPVRMVGAAQDLTQRKAAEAEAQRSRDLLQTVIDSVSDLIFVKDRTGEFVLTNRALDEGCGDLSGRRASDAFADEFADGYDDVDQEVITTGEARTVEETIPIKGELRIFQTIKVPWKKDGDIAGIIGVSRDLTDRIEAESKVRWSASHDPLTNLPNRSLFQQRVDVVIGQALTTGGRVGLLHLDVDHFKQVNDALGHDAGDALLQTFAERLKSAVRSGDMVARLGGDEFAVVLPGLGSDQDITTVVEAMLLRMREPFVHAGRILDCRASIGASLYPQHGTSPEELLRNADIALYTAKASNRGGLVVFQAEMRQELQQRSSMVTTARELLRDDCIIPFYQPKVELGSGRNIGFEALLRWKDRSGNIQLPGSIIAAFDDLEVAALISNRIIDQTITDVRTWLDQGIQFGHVAVNAAAAEFRRDDFAERTLHRLKQAQVPTSCFQLEVTETVFLGRGSEYVHRALKLLSSEGVKIALDDFGTGYASLRHLKQFPVDVLKIDRGFVRDMEKHADDAAIIRAILNLGRSLGIQVVAEGVETDAQAARLRQLGCRYGQGFLYSQAVPAKLVSQLLCSSAPPADAAPYTAKDHIMVEQPLGELAPAASLPARLPRHVYVVDGDPDVREVIELTLQLAGYEVECFGTGAAFLGEAHIDAPGCVVLDKQMPWLSGYDVLEKLMARNSPLKVVMVSGQSDEMTAVRAMKAGAVDFVAKPLKADALLQAVDRALRLAAAEEEGDNSSSPNSDPQAASSATVDTLFL